MKKISKKKHKLFCLVMAMVMLFSNPTLMTTRANNGNSVVVVETNRVAKIREDASKHAAITVELPENSLVYVTGAVTNAAGNVWFEVSYFGETRYLFSESVNEHYHTYEVPVTSEDGSYECYACRCGAIECNPNGMNNVLAPAIYAGVLFGDDVVIAGLAAATVAAYGVARIGEYIIPIMVNTAGTVISLGKSEFDNAVKRYQDENNLNSERCYFPATITKRDETSDTVEIVNYYVAYTLEEACTYLDKVLVADGIYGRLGEFQKKVSFCNIYTYDKDKAIELCKQVIACPANQINSYGDSVGRVQYEENSVQNIEGTYRHFHLHNKLENFYKKTVVHILFGDMLTCKSGISGI